MYIYVYMYLTEESDAVGARGVPDAAPKGGFQQPPRGHRLAPPPQDLILVVISAKFPSTVSLSNVLASSVVVNSSCDSEIAPQVSEPRRQPASEPAQGYLAHKTPPPPELNPRP